MMLAALAPAAYIRLHRYWVLTIALAYTLTYIQSQKFQPHSFYEPPHHLPESRTFPSILKRNSLNGTYGYRNTEVRFMVQSTMFSDMYVEG